MIEKKDWENALHQYESLLINAQVNIAGYEFMVEFCKKKISEFPEEKADAEMLKEIKEDLKI